MTRSSLLFLPILSLSLLFLAAATGCDGGSSDNQRSGGRRRTGGAVERVRVFKVDFKKAKDGTGDTQVCDDNFYNAAEIVLPSQSDSSIKTLKKMIEKECAPLKVKVSDTVDDASDPFTRFRLDGSWPICTLTFKGKTPQGAAAEFSVDLSDGC